MHLFGEVERDRLAVLEDVEQLDPGAVPARAVRLANGARWDSAWIQLLDVYEYRESVIFFFAEEVHTLDVPVALAQAVADPLRGIARQEARAVAESFESYEESFARELAHFHDCVVNGTECRTPPDQARLDMDVLTQMFLKA